MLRNELLHGLTVDEAWTVKSNNKLTPYLSAPIRTSPLDLSSRYFIHCPLFLSFDGSAADSRATGRMAAGITRGTAVIHSDILRSYDRLAPIRAESP